MVQQRQNADPEHGVRVKDYTQVGRSSELRRRLGITAVRGPGNINFDKVGRALFWPSLGLGLLELFMPGRVQKLLGLCDDYTGVIRLMGARELGHAAHIAMASRPHAAAWGRVAGDALDLGLLGAAARQPRSRKSRLGLVTAAILGTTALDLLTATRLRGKREKEKSASTLTQKDLKSRKKNGAFYAVRSITVNRTPEELYQFWRNFENLPKYMYHLEQVQVLDERRSHWVAKAPAGVPVAWDAEITEDRPNELIAWRSLGDAAVPNSGRVHFTPAPAGRGTVVRVEIEYRPPGGAVGKTVAMLFGKEPSQQIKGDLERFKQVVETGEIVRSEGALHGHGQKMQRAARPLADSNKGERMTRAEKQAHQRAQEQERQHEQAAPRYPIT